jgi:serine/threonine protein kinase
MGIGDRYDVGQAMGEGGFSRVYRAQEKATGRPVALKVLKSGFYQNAEVRERFQREVFAVASLSNPHIVGMHDFDLNSDDLYIAMEYVAGHTLRERMRDDFTLAQRFQIISQIGEAIGAAHGRNVVHRDLKPENVKIIEQPDGAVMVKVLDFGMAKLTQLESQLELQPLTRVGICFGTPQYMSPEQIKGKLDDKSIDLYALSTIAYELLAGRRPWDGTDPYEVMRAVLRVPAPAIEHVLLGPGEQPLAPERLVALNAFFTRSLAKRQPERPESAAELIALLEQALFGEAGAPATPTGAPVEAPQRSDDTVPFSARHAVGSLPGIAFTGDSMSDTDRNGIPSIALTRAMDDHAQARAESGGLMLETGDAAALPRASAARDASVESVASVDRLGTAERVARAEARRAAEEAVLASRKKERSFRDLLVPLLVIAALGGSLGYILAGSASAQSSEIHDFLVGAKK